MSEFKKGSLVVMKSGSGTLVVTQNFPASDMVEVCWMGGMEKGIQCARVPSCALKAVVVTKKERRFVDREVVTKVR